MQLRSRRHSRAHEISGLRGSGVLLVFALVILSSLDVRAALRGRIRGTIRDLKGQPVPGLLVRLTSPHLSAVNVTDTDGKGVYAFEELEAGTYDIEVSGSGYQHQLKKGIVVQPPFRNIVDFALPPGPLSAADPASPVVYQPPGSEAPLKEVSGTITDKDKRPIPDALVSLVNPASGRSFRTRSSRDGKIRIAEVPVGVYRAVIASPGYVTMELKQIEVTREAGLVLNLSLVEYPLRFDGRPEDFVPEEEPVPPVNPSPGI